MTPIKMKIYEFIFLDDDSVYYKFALIIVPPRIIKFAV